MHARAVAWMWPVGTVAGVAALALAAGAVPPAHAAEQVPTSGARLELTLAQTLELALRNNPTLVATRLDRALQKYDVEAAEDWFRPQLSSGTLRTDYSVDSLTDETSYRVAAGPLLRMRLPTGGSIDVEPGWTATVNRGGAGPRARTHDDRASLGITLSQPLLRGGGVPVGTAPVRLARLAEERNVLRFRAALMDVVVGTIRTYRALIQAQLRLGIDERSLERARETLAVNQVLVDTGRMAAQDITQTRADIARRELSLVKSRNALDDARRDLNVLLDLPGAAFVVPADSIALEADATGTLDVEASSALARAHNTAYLDAALDLRAAQIERTLAEDNAELDLSFIARADFGSSGDSLGAGLRDLTGGRADGRYSVGLGLRIPLGDDAAKAKKRRRLAARTAVRRAEFALASARRELETDVRNAVRAARTSRQEAGLAREALALAEQKLEIEREKLALGLSSNYRLALFQTDLVDAQVSDVSARIGYLNALTALDRIQGTVLDTWAVDVAGAWEPPE